MAYIIVTTDDGREVYKEYHAKLYPLLSHEMHLFLNKITRAILNAKAYTARQKRLENARSKT